LLFVASQTLSKEKDEERKGLLGEFTHVVALDLEGQSMRGKVQQGWCFPVAHPSDKEMRQIKTKVERRDNINQKSHCRERERRTRPVQSATRRSRIREKKTRVANKQNVHEKVGCQSLSFSGAERDESSAFLSLEAIGWYCSSRDMT
jgi:hypothetical protein